MACFGLRAMREFHIQVGDLTFGAVSCDPALRFRLTDCMRKFVVARDDRQGLVFEVVARDGIAFKPTQVLLEHPAAYAIGLSSDGSYLLRGWAQPGPPCVAQINRTFRRGTVWVPERLARAPGGFYPLATIDIIVFLNWLAATGDVIVHSAGVSDRGKGYLFVGPSGAGKSTMAGLWLDVAGARVLSEDQTILLWRHRKIWAYGGPWHTDAARCAPMGVPLAAVFVLSHGRENRAKACSRMEAVLSIATNGYLPLYQQAGMQAILANLDVLSRLIPVFRLEFRPDTEVVDFVRGLVG